MTRAGPASTVPADAPFIVGCLFEHAHATLGAAADPALVQASLAALDGLETSPSTAPVLDALVREATARLEHVRSTERWLLGAATALLDDAAESESAAAARGWAPSAAREHLDRVRNRPGGLGPAPLRFARLGEQLQPAKAPPVTGIVLHDLQVRAGTLAGSPALARLEGQLSCASGLRAEALDAEAVLHTATESPGAAVMQLRALATTIGHGPAPRHVAGVSELPSPCELRLAASAAEAGERLPPTAADLEALRRAGLRMIEAVADRLVGAQAADPSRPPGTAPSARAAARKASPRAA